LLLRPYNILFLAAALLLVWFWLIAKPQTIDIHLHDTYLVIEHKYLVLAVVLYLMLLAGLYLLFHKKLWSVALTGLHLGITIGFLVFVCFFMQPVNLYTGPAGMPRRYLDYSTWERHYGRLNPFLPVPVIIFLAAQTLLPINIIGGWRRTARA
jgi:heme/copper-type cytochrome/quinol oxidase subunit 1